MCTPSRHIEILAKIPVASSPKQSSSIVTQPTSLGVNDTNVAELSQALQSSLSLSTNKELIEQNTCLESQPKASLQVGEDGKERENDAQLEKDNSSVPVSPPLPIGMKAKVPPAVLGGKGLQANTQLKVNEYHREEPITPTATWPLNQNAKPDFVDCSTEEPACLTQEAKPNEVDNSDDPLKKGQVEKKNPPIPAYEDEEHRRATDDKEQTLEVIAEIPEDINTIGENCQQDAEESSPVKLVSEGKRLITSISQTLDKIVKVPIQENSPPPQPNAGSQLNSQVNKQSDELGTQKVATYFPHSTVPNEILAERPSVNSFEGTPLSSLIEQNDKGMPKARRSQSVGQFPSTPNKHKVGHGNSKSCPPGRRKSSPPKDMVKKPSKSGKESSILSDFFLPKGDKAPVAKYPLRRAGIPNSIVTVNEPHDVATRFKSRSTDVPMIDLESIINEEDKRAHELILAKEIRIQAEAAQLVRDASEKWLSQVPDQKRNDIEQLAIQFLLAMDSTLCFFTVSLRMIALAPWKDSMVAIDVRQAAVVAISKGWFVKSEPFNAYPFSRAELALAAGSYLGKITPTLADDATVALRAIVELLPIVCDEFFAQVSLACPFCQAKAVGVAPIFSTAVTWKSDEWVDLKTALEKATPFVSSIPQNWHAPTCDREDVVPTVVNFGPWAYLEFRPYPVFHDNFFPPLSDIASLLADTSLLDLGLEVVGLAGNNRHYWLVECSQGRPQTAYDSLKGVQKITRELFRSLSVTGLLLTTGTGKKPVLRTNDLDVAAGRVPRVERQAKPIQVAGRSASYRQRKFLMPKLKNLGSPGRNLKSFFHDRPELLVDHPSGDLSQKKRVSSRPPGVKVDAAKRDHKTGSNRPKTARTSGLAQQSVRNGSKKKEVASTERSHIAGKGTGVEKVIPTAVDKNHFLKDHGGQPNPIAINVEEEWPQNEQGFPVPQKGENADKQRGAFVDLEKDVQKNAPPSDPISRFSSDDEERIHAPSRNGKRPFEEVDLDSKAGKHGSPEDQKRRDGGPPQLQSWHSAKEKGEGSTKDAARFRASVETDPANDLESKQEACHITKADESRKLLTDQQLGSEDDVAIDQVQVHGGYRVISLFDGVSPVVPTLTRKFGYAPTVAILAENDTDVRAVVCAEFGYRADEQWSFTPQGTAALYVKDVHSVIANNCHVLRSTIEAYPGLKWIIVGGSPCQDLTFAGPHKGLLGLAGPCSRLFFVFLCIIFTVQQLCGPQAVRFLAENAASMLEMHYRAFCKLLNIDPMPPDKYLWNPSNFGYQVTRRRNFFRNFDDVESIPSPTLVFGDHYGPLLRPNGDTIPLAPLLRTRDTLPNGIIRASWTLYQPHALVWDYAYWNGKGMFASKVAVGTNNIPRCQWESIIPPPFLEQWKAFLELLSSHNFQGNEVDAIVLPLIPMFHTEAFNLPLRILKEQEVIQLSGLHDFWNNVSLSDAELVPEALLRNVCGNCFHPDLIGSALGSNTILRSWAKGDVEGPSRYVMNQTEAHAVFSVLCEQIEKESKKKGRCKKLHLDKTLPPYEVLQNVGTTTAEPNTKCTKKNGSCKSTGQPAIGLHQSSANHGTLPDKKVHPQVSHIHPSTVLLPKKVRVTKDMRFTQHCIAAASQLLTPQQTSALKYAGMQRIFAALRAPVHVNFQFKDYIAKLLGADPGKLQKMSSNPEAQCPDLTVVEELHNSFKRWEQQPGVCSLMAVCIAAAACKVGTSWPLGHLLLLPNGEEVYACHVGAETPKLLFLVDCKQCQYPLVTVVSATAYNTGLQLGTLPRWGHSCWKIRGGHHDSDFVVEQRDGQWIMHIATCAYINPAFWINGMEQTESNTLLAPLLLTFVSIIMDHSPRGCDHCSHGTSTVGEPSTRGNISCEGASGS